jgi:aminoglycoside phosphotransferase family enzyme
VPTIEDKVAFLSEPSSYGPSVKKVDVRQTHMSWVFLTEHLVFKLKKPVWFPYLDFTTLSKRWRACRAEVELNRRLAADVYLGIAALWRTPSGLTLREGGDIVDWLVVMRRLDQSRMIENLIAANKIDVRLLDQLASKLAHFYRTAARVFLQPDDFLGRWKNNLQQNRILLLDPRFRLPAGCIRHIDDVMKRYLSGRKSELLLRLHQRRIVDGHGDLRPEHIWLGNDVKIIDCVEFNSRFRALDPLEEIAYLDLECRHLGAAGIGDYVRARVMSALRDDPPPSLFYFYRCYRAMLRARLSIAHLLSASPRTPEKWRPQALAYLEFAAADARRLEDALRKQADRKAISPHAGGGWPLPAAAHRKAPRFC